MDDQIAEEEERRDDAEDLRRAVAATRRSGRRETAADHDRRRHGPEHPHTKGDQVLHKDEDDVNDGEDQDGNRPAVYGAALILR